MSKNLFGKEMVLGVVILFIGAGIIPSIASNVSVLTNTNGSLETARGKVCEHSLKLPEDSHNLSRRIIKISIPENPQEHKIIDGEWVRIVEWTNPWAWAGVGGDNFAYASISKETGVGEAMVPDNYYESGTVGLYISPLDRNYLDPEEYCQWNGESTSGMIVIKEPSRITWLMCDAGLSVWIVVKEYDVNYNYIRLWEEIVFNAWVTQGASYETESLDNRGLEFDLEQNRLYTVSVSVLAGSTPHPPNPSYCEIKPVEFKKLWLCAYLEEPAEINIVEPEEGILYLQGHKCINIGYPGAVLLFCPNMPCDAHIDGGDVDFVKFECGGKTCTDYTPDNNDDYSCTLTEVPKGLRTLYAYAYSDGVSIDQDSIRILKFP